MTDITMYKAMQVFVNKYNPMLLIHDVVGISIITYNIKTEKFFNDMPLLVCFEFTSPIPWSLSVL